MALPIHRACSQPTCRATEKTGATGLEPATSGVTGRPSRRTAHVTDVDTARSCGLCSVASDGLSYPNNGLGATECNCTHNG